MIETSNLT